MKLQIHTIEKTIFDGDIKSLTLPTEAGEITVLENHLPLVTLTRPGLIRIIDKSNKESIINFSSFGFLEVKPEKEGVTLISA
ncbi:MAG: F0F1 ATP synthase subunit epsilon [bacterium]|nr:F0F1 ATP synthase subunit epsilon [bacterium]